MATPIPLFVSMIESSGETVQVNGGSASELPDTRYFFLVSNRTTASDGQSLLYWLKGTLDALSTATAWTVVMTLVNGVPKIQLSHNHASSRTVGLSPSFATALGFSSASFAVATATTVTADYPSYWCWSPDMPISLTGPEGGFDPSVSYGVPESAGASQRAPDMTYTSVQNGVQWSAEYFFQGVEYYYKIKPQSGYTNRDLETWWINGPAAGRRFLMWRDRSNAMGSNAPSEGASAPYYYIEYAPQESLRGTFPAKMMAPPNLVFWDVKLDCWLTENGGAVLSD